PRIADGNHVIFPVLSQFLHSGDHEFGSQFRTGFKLPPLCLSRGENLHVSSPYIDGEHLHEPAPVFFMRSTRVPETLPRRSPPAKAESVVSIPKRTPVTCRFGSPAKGAKEELLFFKESYRLRWSEGGPDSRNFKTDQWNRNRQSVIN